MSREELVDAYANGRISRRVFVRHLLAAGVTATSALAFARVLSGNQAGASELTSAQPAHHMPMHHMPMHHMPGLQSRPVAFA